MPSVRRRGVTDVGAAKISGVCRLGADPELRYTTSGAAVCSVRAVFQDRYLDKNTGEWKDGKALWCNLIGWRQLGENMAESFAKGDEVMVLDGTLEVREYEKREGGTGYSTEVTVRDIGLSVRFNTATAQRVDRQYNGPAAGPVVDPWTGEPARQQPPARQGGQPVQGQWQGSGQPVQPQARFDPVTGQPLAPNGGYTDEPPF